MRRYFTNVVQFNTVVNFCGSVGVVATTATNRWPSPETVNPRGLGCKFRGLEEWPWSTPLKSQPRSYEHRPP